MDGVIARGKDVRKMQMLWIGLLVYNIGYMYSELVDFPSALIIRLFFYAGLLLFMYPVLISIVDIFTTLNRAGRYLKIVMWLTIGWSFVSLLHVGGDGEFSVGKVVTPYLLLPYMAIVLVLMSSENLLRSFFSIGGKMGYLFFLISVIPLSSTVSFGFIQMLLENFAVFGALIFLTNKYQSARNAAFPYGIRGASVSVWSRSSPRRSRPRTPRPIPCPDRHALCELPETARLVG